MIIAKRKAAPKIKKAVKTKAQYAALNKLNSFLNKNDKRLVKILVRTWNDQSKAITYKELREAILNGSMTAQQFKDWQEDYNNFFVNHLADTLKDAAYAGAKDFAEAIARGEKVYTPTLTGINKWLNNHGAQWVTQMSAEGEEAIMEMVRYSAKGNLTVDELARVIRPTIGLNAPQSKANVKYYEAVKNSTYEKLINSGVKEATAEKQAAKKAEESALRYAARQHRQRASMIAQTELAFAYNKGNNLAVKQMMKDGTLPKMKAVWVTAKDEAVCTVCGKLDGKEVAVGDEFEFPGKSLYGGQKETPPAHPRCRCVVSYEEIADINGHPTYEEPATEPTESDSGATETGHRKNIQERTKTLVEDMENEKIKYNPTSLLKTPKTEDEIIFDLGGGDLTSGSCASLALAYAGQKCNIDVLDFRGGESLNYFSMRLNRLNFFSGLPNVNVIEQSAKSNLTAGNQILKKVEKGKEYILMTGRHSAVVRRTAENVLQYLELQSRYDNGWTDFGKSARQTLQQRFGCTSAGFHGLTFPQAYMVDIEELKEYPEDLREILGYINTPASEQKKGSKGYAK